ncbi:MAG: GspH/FimT family pseudopilin [Pseudomonadota bacterium]
MTRSARADAGMTLVEIMVVVFIIGLASTLVVLNLPRGASPAQRAAEGLQTQLIRWQDQAILSGAPIGLVVEEERYSAAIWRRGDWQAFGPVTALERQLRLTPEDIETQLAAANGPSIVFDPTGVTPSARFRLAGQGEVFIISLTDDGDVRVEAR